MRHVAARKRLRGVTLLELTISISLLALFGGAAFLATETAGKSFRTEVVSSSLNAEAHKALGIITHQLRAADAGEIGEVGAPFFETAIAFRRAVGFDDATETPLWGDPERIELEYDPGDPNDGLDNDGDGLVDEGRLVHLINPGTPDERRSVLCNHVSESLAGETLGNLIDDNGNGLEDERGFCFIFDGTRATLRLTLAQRDKWGHLIEHSFEKSVALRNRQAP